MIALRKAIRPRLVVLVVAAIVVATAAAVPSWRPHEQDAMALAELRVSNLFRSGPDRERTAAKPSPSNPYRDQHASGRALRVIKAARTQIGVPYTYGARPRHQWSMSMIGTSPNHLGVDCSSLVAYAFQTGVGVWIGGGVAHTDEIWTQDSRMPLTAAPAHTESVLRGTGAKPPPGGYLPGDILFRHVGAGGYWGHVAILSEHGMIIEAFPPDVHETREITEFLADGSKLGWMRVREVNG